MERNSSRIRYALTLSKHIHGFGMYLFFSILINLIYKLLPILTSLITSYTVSAILLQHTAEVTTLLIVTGVLVLLTALFAYLDVQISHDMAYRILAQLRNLCYDKLDELAPAALVGERSGDMISIVLQDVETLEWFYAHTISQIVVAFFLPVSILFFMGSFSLLLPMIVLPFIVILLYIPGHYAKQADKQGLAVKTATGKLFSVIVDGVQGLKDILSFQRQQQYLRQFFEVNSEYANANRSYAKRRAHENRMLTLMIELSALLVDITIAALVGLGRISPLWLMPLFILSKAIFTPIMDALMMSTNYGLIFGAAKRMLDLFEKKPAISDQGTHSLDLSGPEVSVAFTDVAFSYPAEASDSENTPVLQNLSFFLRNGESVALVGASGSGKTTIARLLQRFWDVDKGSIRINGCDIRKMPLENLRIAVTSVPQEVYLFNQTVLENLHLANPNASDEDIRQAARLAQAEAFIQKLPDGYDTKIGERGVRLSGGEKQRLSIAQALLKNAPILILDESSANLDAENEKWINRAIQHLKKDRATLIIAHRISTIRSADHIIVLREGRVEDQGSYDQLIGRCSYFRTLLGDTYRG